MTDQELDLIKEEYRRLSQEINSALAHRLQIIQFGLLFVGVLVGYALDQSPSPMIPTFLIPGACLMILLLWASEVRRARRASWYLFGLERRVNDILQARVLRWEGDIRERRWHQLSLYRLHYYVIAGFFITIAQIEAIYGASIFPKWNENDLFRIGWPLFLGILMASTVGYYVVVHLPKYDFPDKNWPNAIEDRPATKSRKKQHIKKSDLHMS